MTRLRSTRMVVGSIAALAVLAGCGGQMPSIPGSIGAVGSIGKAVMDRPSFTEQDEIRIAQENARKFEAQNKMWQQPLLEDYLTQLSQRIVAVAKPRPFPYRVRIVADPNVNAFTFGGGLVYFHAGLLARMDNEAQVVMVLAHEIAHVTESHVVRGMEARYGLQLLGQLAAGAAGTNRAIPPVAIAKAYEYTMSAAISGHGRGNESEADEVGLDYMVKAGWDPREAPRTFEVLLKEYGDPKPLQHFFYGSHPTNAARIQHTTQLAATKYAREVAERRLTVNTEEFTQRTRQLVVATARLDYDAKRFNIAAAMFQKAMRVDPKDPVPHHYLGKIALETGSDAGAVDRAVGHLNDAIQAKAEYAPAYRELGLAYNRKRDRSKAIESFERYLALDPKARDAAQIRAAIAELKRD